jgi:SNF2 family DNA or RNA helicase
MGTTYKFKTKPYRHQVKALRKLMKNGYGGELFMDPRTGKSKTAVDYGSMLATKGRIDKIVIICPARVMHVWIEQFHKHCPLIYHTTIWDAKERRKGPPPPVRGSYDLNVVIVNYEAFATPGKRLKSGRRSKATGRFKNRQNLRKWMHSTDKRTLMILDESHRIASPSGSAANMIVSMHQDAYYRLILTGTPVTKAKKAHDLYMQYKFANPAKFPELGTADEFKNAFGRWIHDNGYPQWIGPKNQQLLQRRIHETGVVVKRDDCFDLPPKQIFLRKIPLTSSASAYDQMATNMVATITRVNRRRSEILSAIEEAQAAEDKDLVKELREQLKDEVHTVEASIKLVQGLRLRQITGGVATTDEGKLIRIGREKLNALKDEFEAAAEHDEKVIVAAQFRADLASIERMAKREFGLRTFVLKGGIPIDQSARDIREFERHDGAAVFVVQPQSGSEGIDLSTSAHLIWYSLTPSWVKYTQMNDRIALSRNSTSFTYLLGENTVDEVLYDTLQLDGQVARAILEKPQQLLRNPDQMQDVEKLLNEWEL